MQTISVAEALSKYAEKLDLTLEAGEAGLSKHEAWVKPPCIWYCTSRGAGGASVQRPRWKRSRSSTSAIQA